MLLCFVFAELFIISCLQRYDSCNNPDQKQNSVVLLQCQYSMRPKMFAFCSFYVAFKKLGSDIFSSLFSNTPLTTSSLKSFHTACLSSWWRMNSSVGYFPIIEFKQRRVLGPACFRKSFFDMKTHSAPSLTKESRNFVRLIISSSPCQKENLQRSFFDNCLYSSPLYKFEPAKLMHQTAFIYR